jgi:uncharacterized protein YigE (DUF2233 family)
MRWRTFALSLGCILSLCATDAEAQWIQRQSQTESSIVPGVVHQHLVVTDSSGGAEITLEVVNFSPKSAKLRLIDNPDGRAVATALDREKNVAGVNGGYFDENFGPLGLRISDGKTVSPLVRSRLLTGVMVSSGSTIQIWRFGEFAKSTRAAMAIQSGPFLIDRARVVVGLDPKREARRTFVAVTSANQIMLGFSTDISLARLSSVLAGGVGELKIQRALNLDGGSSSAFWFKRKDGSIFSISEQKSVRDCIAVTPQ